MAWSSEKVQRKEREERNAGRVDATTDGGWNDRASEALEDRPLLLDAGRRLERIARIAAHQRPVSIGRQGGTAAGVEPG
jgi:hypothetical protein